MSITNEQAERLLEFVKSLASDNNDQPFSEDDYIDVVIEDYAGGNVDDAADFGGRVADWFTAEYARGLLKDIGL